jgi:hypothetical protein
MHAFRFWHHQDISSALPCFFSHFFLLFLTHLVSFHLFQSSSHHVTRMALFLFSIVYIEYIISIL